MQVQLDVSVGEALDKYSILEIKNAKIKDAEKLKHVQKEMETIYPRIKVPLTEFKFHYERLLEVNRDIWEDQDIFRDDKTLTPQQRSDLCIKIIEDNDRRFRIKSKINNLSNSLLKEQKGYNPKKALVFHHLGMGDMMTMCGAIRYFATVYDEVLVVCKKMYKESTELMYKDDNTIKLLLINETIDLKPPNARLNQYKQEGYDIYLSGQSIVPHINRNVKPFYVKFYKDINLPYEYRFKYGHVYRDTHREENLYKKLIKVNPDYIFVHDKPHQRLLKNWNHAEQTFVFNVNLPFYPSHFAYHNARNIASQNECIFNFGKIMENAKELHLLDSAFFCYAQFLDLSKVQKCIVYVREYYDLSKYFHPDQKWEVKLLK